MALDPSISLNAKAPDQFTGLKDMLGIANAATAFKSGQLDLRKANELYESDVARSKGESLGSQATSRVTQANEQPLIQQQQAITSGAQTQAAHEKFNLSKDYGSVNASVLGGLTANPAIAQGTDQAAMFKATREARQELLNRGVPEDMVDANIGSLQGAITSNPQSVHGMLLQKQRSNIGSPEQVARDQVAPVAQQAVGLDAQGNPSVTYRGQTGEVQGQAPVQNLGTQQRPVAPAPLSVGDRELIPQLTTDRTNLQAAASKVPDQRYNNSQIMRIADSGELLQGKLGEKLNNLFSAAGYHIGNNAAENFNSLAHYNANAIASNSAAMGVHSDAGQMLTAKATGNPLADAKTIKRATEQSDASATGLGMYQKGTENAIAGAGGDVRAAVQFRKQWVENYTPIGTMFANASARNDKPAMQEIIKGLGGLGSPAAKQMLQKLHNMNVLSEKGAL